MGRHLFSATWSRLRADSAVRLYQADPEKVRRDLISSFVRSGSSEDSRGRSLDLASCIFVMTGWIVSIMCQFKNIIYV